MANLDDRPRLTGSNPYLRTAQICFFVFFVLSTAHAFFTWSIPNQALYALFILALPIMTWGLIDVSRVAAKKVKIAFFIFGVYVVIALPFREYSDFGLWFFLSFIVMLVVLLKTEYQIRIVNVLAAVIALASASALVVFLANLFGII